MLPENVFRDLPLPYAPGMLVPQAGPCPTKASSHHLGQVTHQHPILPALLYIIFSACHAAQRIATWSCCCPRQASYVPLLVPQGKFFQHLNPSGSSCWGSSNLLTAGTPLSSGPMRMYALHWGLVGPLWSLGWVRHFIQPAKPRRAGAWLPPL